MGAVTYSNEVKTAMLGVPKELLDQYGAVNPQVAKQMADGIRRRSGADFGIGITGLAGPDGGTPEKPVGLVYLALSDSQNIWVREMRRTTSGKGRGHIRNLAASNALDMIRRRVLNLGGMEYAAYSREKA